jgi:hypothetical protein
MMSGPSSFWIFMADSGVMRTAEPSTMDLNDTPSSSTALMSAIEYAW